jgi:predicted dehydrogenase
MSKPVLNVAMIGHGFIGRVHSNAFHQVGRFFDSPLELRCRVVCGRERTRLEAMAAQWGWDEVETDWRAVIDRDDVDIVDIATPNSLHAPIALAAAAAGKIVFCEKPLAMSLAEAEQMAGAVGDRPSLVWFNYRRVPAIAFAKSLLEQGRIGEIFHYRGLYLNQSGADATKAASWRYSLAQAGSGVVGDLLSHVIDLALELNGPIEQLHALTHTFAPGREVEDAALVSVRFANGSLGNFEASRFGVGCRNRNSFEINGARGMLGFNFDRMNELKFYDASEAPNLQGVRDLQITGPDHPYWRNFWKPGHSLGFEHTFIATLGDFLSSWERSARFHPNFGDGVAVQRVLRAVEQSAQLQAWISLA